MTAPDIVQSQREWDRTYKALAEGPVCSNTRLRRRLIDLSRQLVRDAPRERRADLRRRAGREES
ncbi:hypothetical protein ACFVDQ_32180 [Streptomyces sp. NPDC057684]|uniref:hypothetical protein n=1 Tax=unclassified Streptomyces TaxID=2593676 RepID=UPI00368C8D51